MSQSVIFCLSYTIKLLLIDQCISCFDNLIVSSCCIIEELFEFLNAGIPFPNKAVGWVNVKDVADTHIRAYEIAPASGRYLLAERVVHYSELATILRDMYPTLRISDK